MRPGLGGWVVRYASSIEILIQTLYDLYYLRHFSTWLDLIPVSYD